MNNMTYKGYSANIEFDEEAKIILQISSILSWTHKKSCPLRAAFSECCVCEKLYASLTLG